MTTARPEKMRLQMELKLQADMISSLHKQGWYANKTVDRFKAGKPDLRIAHDDYGQMDVELKYKYEDYSVEEDVGMTKLQMLTLRDMNRHGMPAICLVYSEPINTFFVTTVLRDTLPPLSRCVQRLASEVILGPILFVKAMEHLNELGHHTNPRTWWTAWPNSRA
jgi:hypothetical protein